MNFKAICKRCKESVHCCIFKNFSGFTFVGKEDAKAIKIKTKKEYAQFLDDSPLPAKVITLLKHDDPCLEGALRHSQLDKDKRIPRLKTKKDGRCIFLDNQGDCKIYSIRPKICRIYPFWGIMLNNGKLKIIEHDTNPRCPIIKMIKRKDDDIEKVLSKSYILNLQRIFRSIQKEDCNYQKNNKKNSNLKVT
jgi:Fe-S-cluster containining protein